MMSGKKSPNSPAGDNVTSFTLEAANELRFEVDEAVKIALRSGTAELLGSELVKDKKFCLTRRKKGAIFTFTGCRITVEEGSFSSAYVSSEVAVNHLLLNVHSCLEEKRKQAEKDEGRGPCVLFCGPADVGKSSAMKILAGYATRRNHKPIVVDLDVDQNDLSLPGSISAQCVTRPLQWELQWDQEEEPLVFPFGYTSPSGNLALYKHLVQKLVESVEVRLENEAACLHSGLLINTCGWIEDDGIELIKLAAAQFEADYIFVIDSERLANHLKSSVPESSKVIRIPKSPGVVQRSNTVRQANRDLAVRAYFHGRMGQLSPFRVALPLATYSFYKLSAMRTNARLDTLIPHSTENGQNKGIEFWRVPMRIAVSESNSKSLFYRICAISQASNPEDIADCSVFGFVCIEEVKVGAFVTVISPSAELPPSSILLLTEVQYLDTTPPGTK